MASLLRSIVAGPRARHPEAGLDLCYVTDNIIATSGPSGTYPQRAYRNPLDALVRFLDSKHDAEWAIWEFRAEGTGYPDSEVYNRVWHFPWPDHHPPPFHLIPNIMASMRNWLRKETDEDSVDDKSNDKKSRVAVVHCKAGKGRSGTVTCSYLLSEEGWTKEEALQRFTDRRMRPGMGKGVSIPSQLRWIDYVDRWAKNGKIYIERQIQVMEVHVEGLRDGVKIAVEGFVDEGRTIKTFHVFKREERDDYKKGDEVDEKMTSLASVAMETAKSRWRKDDKTATSSSTVDVETEARPNKDANSYNSDTSNKQEGQESRPPTEDTTSKDPSNVIFRPSKDLIVPTNDINLAVERRSRAGYGLTMVTSVAHVWFNCFFEGNGPDNTRRQAESPEKGQPGSDGPDASGVYTITWDAMDGIKGSSRKGMCAFDKVSIVWRAIRDGPGVVVTQPAEGESIQDELPADWKGPNPIRETEDGKAEDGTDKSVKRSENSTLGIRPERPDSAEVSKASSLKSASGASDASANAGKKLMDAAMKLKIGESARSGAADDDEDSEDGAAGIQRGIAMPTKSSDKILEQSQNELESSAVTGNVAGRELRDRKEHPLGDIKVDKKHNISSS